MITPIIAAQTAAPAASIQQNQDAQAMLQSSNANKNVKEEERQLRESVIHKDEAVLYERRQDHDASEEGRNKYTNLYNNKKKKSEEKKEETEPVKRVNFDIKI